MTWELALAIVVTVPALLATPLAIYLQIRGGDPKVSRPPGCKGTENCMCFSCELMREIIARTKD